MIASRCIRATDLLHGSRTASSLPGAARPVSAPNRLAEAPTSSFMMTAWYPSRSLSNQTIRTRHTTVVHSTAVVTDQTDKKRTKEEKKRMKDQEKLQAKKDKDEACDSSDSDSDSDDEEDPEKQQRKAEKVSVYVIAPHII